ALLDTRIWVQALYRDYTGQVPPVAEPPPVALVQIDTASISRSGISKVQPIDRSYLAQIVDRLTELNTPLIGLDFVLDTPQAQDKTLAKAIQTAVSQNGTWFVFAAILDTSGEIGVNSATGIASPNWSLQGHIDADPHYVMLPYPNEDCRHICPFAHLLALVHTAQRYPPNVPLPQPQLNHQQDLRLHFLNTIDAHRSPTHPLTPLRKLHLSPLSVWVYDQWGQHWLEPIIDFSIPADRVYDRIPAWQLLETDQLDTERLSQQIVLIAPGDDERMGLSPGKPDRFPIPAALRYWNSQYWLTGSESLAYMMHHQLTQRLVIPIPDLWMVVAIVLLGKSVSLWLNNQTNQRQWTRQQHRVYIAGLTGLTTFYGLVSLQLYISSSLLLPWLLPSALLWAYLLPAFRSSTNA
ncbi:MAG TPA: CHASE2 domain-containing protein, partial [Allocoleopsis sp.]